LTCKFILQHINWFNNIYSIFNDPVDNECNQNRKGIILWNKSEEIYHVFTIVIMNGFSNNKIQVPNKFLFVLKINRISIFDNLVASKALSSCQSFFWF